MRPIETLKRWVRTYELVAAVISVGLMLIVATPIVLVWWVKELPDLPSWLETVLVLVGFGATFWFLIGWAEEESEPRSRGKTKR